MQTLVREIQTHPYRNEVVHVDFLRLQKGVSVEMNIPLRFEGTPRGVKNDGGVLDQVLHDIPVRCIPSAYLRRGPGSGTSSALENRRVPSTVGSSPFRRCGDPHHDGS